MPSNVEISPELVDLLMADSIGRVELDDEQLTDKPKTLVGSGRYTTCPGCHP